jgi:hypothetical protein
VAPAVELTLTYADVRDLSRFRRRWTFPPYYEDPNREYCQGDVVYDITFSGAPRPPQRGVPVVEGPHCLCNGAPGAVHARLTGKTEGEFLPFEVSGGGHAADNHGGREATVTLQGDAKTDSRATVIAVYRKKDGATLRSAPFTVHFCEAAKPEAQANEYGNGRDYLFDDATPGHVEVGLSGKAWLDGEEAASRLHWIESSGPLSAKNPIGEQVTYTADGLPPRNSDFGPRQIVSRPARASAL